MPNAHKGHRARVKQEFLQNGLEHFPDHKKLELLLYFSVTRSDTNPLGHQLMERFGSISGLFDAPYELILETPGIGNESATLIKLVSAMIREYMDDYTSRNNIIRDTEDAKAYMRHKFLCEQCECLYMACMGNNGKIVFCSRVAEGSPETVRISPALIVKTALRANAVKVLLAHNHPNGICNPSSRDLSTTSILYDELKRVEVELIDHVIVAPDGVYSMKENNMFPANRL